MDTEQFLSRILPEGVHFLMYPSDKLRSDGKPFMNHAPFNSPSDGVKKGFHKSSLQKDVWFTVAGFYEAKVTNPRTGKLVAGRYQTNVSGLKALFIDLDFKQYDSPTDAFASLSVFLNESGIEKPTIIVNSGNGLHVYWTFKEVMTLEEWQGLADGLAGLCVNKGLRIDQAVTIDSARVLRLPGTINYKEPQTHCVIVAHRDEDCDLDRMRDLLKGVRLLNVARRARGVGFGVDPEVVAIFGGASDDLSIYDDVPKSMALIASQCAVIGDMVARGGDGDPRDLWNLGLLLAAYTTDGREYAHLMSKGDSRYTTGETEFEFDQKLIEKDRIGPTTCAAFSMHSQKCSSCPFNGKIKSPIQLGVESNVSPLVGGLARNDYKPTISKDGGTYFPVMTPNGVELIKVFNQEMSEDPLRVVGGKHIQFSFRTLDNRVARVIVDHRIVHKPDVVAPFTEASITVPKAARKFLDDVIMAWIDKLAQNPVLPPETSFGWLSLSDRNAFAMGDRIYTPGNIERMGTRHPSIVAKYTAKGDPTPWKILSDRMVKDGRTEIQIILASAFAGPLMRFTSEATAIMAVRSSKSGVGKTAAMKAARAVWGDPTDMSQASDTPVAVELTIGELRDMPWYWDELQVRDGLAASLFQLVQGKLKSRGRPDVTVNEGKRARGLLVVATNASIKEAMDAERPGSDAGQARILELEVTRFIDGNTADHKFADLVAQLTTNHGHAGEAYIRWIVDNPEIVAAKSAAVSDLIYREFGVQRDERYRISAAKAIILGAVLANLSGVVTFDVPRIILYLKKQLATNRGEAPESVEDIKEEILNYLGAGRVLITDTFDHDGRRGRGRVSRNHTNTTHNHLPPEARIAVAEKTLTLTLDGVREFARERKRPLISVTEKLAEDAINSDRLKLRINLTAGLKLPPARKRGFVFNLTEAEATEWAISAGVRLDATPDSSLATAQRDLLL